MPVSSRVTAAVGWLGVAAFGIGSLIAGVTYVGADGEHYSLLNHYVSELGSRQDSELGTLFNVGLVVGALCLLVFLVEVGRRIGGRRGTLISVLGVAAGIGGSLVGFIPIDVKGMHALVASVYFGSLAMAVALTTAWMGGSRLPRTGVATVLGVITALSSAGYFVIYLLEGPGYGGSSDPNAPRPPVALDTTVEWIALISVMAWVTAVALTIWRTDADPAGVPEVSAVGRLGE